MDPVAATTTAAQTPANPAGTSLTDGATVAGDFQTFLTLLTTQLQNQDPLEPMDSTEFVSQLASFSAVEQQVQSNTKLDAILDALTGGPGAGLAEWVGKEVRAATSTAFDGSPLTIETDPESSAQLGVLNVRDEAGKVLAQISIDPKAKEIVWSGEGTTGQLGPGNYSFTVDYYSDNELVKSESGSVFAPVVEVRLENDEAVLVFADGTRMPASDVTAVRLPQDTQTPG